MKIMHVLKKSKVTGGKRWLYILTYEELLNKLKIKGKLLCLDERKGDKKNKIIRIWVEPNENT